jgi:hypothetical protein
MSSSYLSRAPENAARRRQEFRHAVRDAVSVEEVHAARAALERMNPKLSRRLSPRDILHTIARWSAWLDEALYQEIVADAGCSALGDNPRLDDAWAKRALAEVVARFRPALEESGWVESPGEARSLWSSLLSLCAGGRLQAASPIAQELISLYDESRSRKAWSVPIARLLLKAPDLPPRMLQRLYEDALDAWGRAEVLHHPNVPPDLYLRYAEDGAWSCEVYGRLPSIEGVQRHEPTWRALLQKAATSRDPQRWRLLVNNASGARAVEALLAMAESFPVEAGHILECLHAGHLRGIGAEAFEPLLSSPVPELRLAALRRLQHAVPSHRPARRRSRQV